MLVFIETKTILVYILPAMAAGGFVGFIIDIIISVTRLQDKESYTRLVPYTSLVEEIIGYTNNILSERKIKYFPGYQIRYYRNKKYAGCFDGRVVIFLKSNNDIKDLVVTTLHEVAHYIQSQTDKQYRIYDTLTDSYGYWNNPLEVQARKFASEHCASCLKYLESKGIIKKGRYEDTHCSS